MNILYFNISLTLMISIVLLVRAVGKGRISKSMVCTLWIIVMVRALVPFSIPAVKIPLIKEAAGELSRSEMAERIPEVSGRIQNTMLQNPLINGSEAVHSLNIGHVAGVVWIIGLVCVALYFGRAYRRERRALQRSCPIHYEMAERMIRFAALKRKVRLYMGDSFSTPVTYGILRPKILIPSELQEISRVDMRNMVAHELIHIQRFDVAKRYMAAAVLCMYWYHPLVWLMFRLFHEDQELACDEKALRGMGAEGARSYVYTMIKMAVEDRPHLILSGFWGKDSGRQRVLAAINHKKVKKLQGLALLPVSLVLILFFINFMPLSGQSSQNSERIGSSLVSDATVSNGQSGMELEETVKIEPETETLMEQPETEFERMSDEEYVRVMTDISENYNDVTQPLTQEQERALTQLHLYTMAQEYKKKEERGGTLTEEERNVMQDYAHNPMP